MSQQTNEGEEGGVSFVLMCISGLFLLSCGARETWQGVVEMVEELGPELLQKKRQRQASQILLP